jgi:bile acid-coenzyme A ligase
MGQVVHAILERLPSAPPLDNDDLRGFLAQRLSPDKIPRSVEVTMQRLRDDAGKARRGAWRDLRGAAGGHANVA